jgi:hypothetical protein
MSRSRKDRRGGHGASRKVRQIKRYENRRDRMRYKRLTQEECLESLFFEDESYILDEDFHDEWYADSSWWYDYEPIVDEYYDDWDQDHDLLYSKEEEELDLLFWYGGDDLYYNW